MSIEELEEIREDYLGMQSEYTCDYYFMSKMINLFKDQQSQITDLQSKVKKLERNRDYLTEEELLREKIGGTD